jgi:hypothetical protein
MISRVGREVGYAVGEVEGECVGAAVGAAVAMQLLSLLGSYKNPGLQSQIIL